MKWPQGVGEPVLAIRRWWPCVDSPTTYLSDVLLEPEVGHAWLSGPGSPFWPCGAESGCWRHTEGGGSHEARTRSVFHNPP